MKELGGNGSIAVAGTQVASAPRVSRAVFLSHTSRCSVKFSSAHGGGRGRGGSRSAARRGARRVTVWAKALGREVCSPASWRCVPRRVSACAKARRPAALSTSGGLGRYWAAQWHLARAVGKRFRGCRAKRLYVHTADLERRRWRWPLKGREWSTQQRWMVGDLKKNYRQYKNC